MANLKKKPIATHDQLLSDIDGVLHLAQILWQSRKSHECTTKYSTRNLEQMTVAIGFDVDPEKDMDLEKARRNFNVPKFILDESAFFKEKIYLEVNPNAHAEGPDTIRIYHRPDNFHLVVMLFQLRWLVRLHVALVLLDCERLSLRRSLLGLLHLTVSDVEPKTVPMVMDRLIDHIRMRFGSAWPSFLKFVSKQDSHSMAKRIEYSMCNRGALYTPTNAFLAQVCDDIFIAAMVQTDGKKHPYKRIQADVKFFCIQEPQLNFQFQTVQTWMKAPSQAKYRYIEAARREAHHLVIAMERGYVSGDDADLVQAACELVGHQRTFSSGLRRRLLFVCVDGRDEEEGTPFIQWSPEQNYRFKSWLASDRDVPRLDAKEFDKFREEYVRDQTEYAIASGMAPQTELLRFGVVGRGPSTFFEEKPFRPDGLEEPVRFPPSDLQENTGFGSSACGRILRNGGFLSPHHSFQSRFHMVVIPGPKTKMPDRSAPPRGPRHLWSRSSSANVTPRLPPGPNSTGRSITPRGDSRRLQPLARPSTSQN